MSTDTDVTYEGQLVSLNDGIARFEWVAAGELHHGIDLPMERWIAFDRPLTLRWTPTPVRTSQDARMGGES